MRLFCWRIILQNVLCVGSCFLPRCISYRLAVGTLHLLCAHSSVTLRKNDAAFFSKSSLRLQRDSLEDIQTLLKNKAEKNTATSFAIGYLFIWNGSSETPDSRGTERWPRRAEGNAALAVCHSECWGCACCPPEAFHGALGAAGLRTSSHSLMAWEEQPWAASSTRMDQFPRWLPSHMEPWGCSRNGLQVMLKVCMRNTGSEHFVWDVERARWWESILCHVHEKGKLKPKCFVRPW